MVLGRDFRFVWRRFCLAMRVEWKLWLGRILVFFVLSGLVLFPNDLALLSWVRGDEPERLERVEKLLGFWGDFLQFNVLVGLLLVWAGSVRKNRWLRRAAMAFLLAGALSGGTARVVKWTTGRARPITVEREELHWVTFTGPSASGKFHGYFSGHTAATWGSAVALLVVFPRFGWLAVVFAAAVGWSRMIGNHHFPSDVVHGAAWGVMWGCLVGGGMRKARGNAKVIRGKLHGPGSG